MHSYIPFIWHRAVQLVFANMGIPKREWFCMRWPQTVALSSSYLTDPSLLFVFKASVLVTTGCMRRFPAAQSGSTAPPGWHILMGGRKKVFCVSRQSLKSMEEIQGDRPLHKES